MIDHLVYATPDIDATVETIADQTPEPGRVCAALRALGLDLAIDEAPVPALMAIVEGPAGRLELR